MPTPTIVSVQRANHGTHFRAYTLREAALINPFLGVDHAWMSEPTFPPHSHAGLSAVSYVFLDSETGIANSDSAGAANIIEPGAVHWMVAGKGVVHEEAPAEPGKTVHSLQIFVRLPHAVRAAEPYSISLAPLQIPTVQRPGAKVRVVAGSFDGHHAPGHIPTDVDMFDVSLETGATLSLPVAPGRAVFVLPIFGAVEIDGTHFGLNELKVPVFSARSDCRDIQLHAPDGTAKVMVFGGSPFTPSPSEPRR